MALYESTQFIRALDVNAIYTIHYFEYYRGYRFKGETHDFWEFIYADRGALSVRAGDTEFTLRQGQLALHPPGEFHAVATAGNAAANAIVVSFDCVSEELRLLCGHVINVSMNERPLLSGIVNEARSVFSNDLGDPGLTRLTRRDEGWDFGAEQYILLMLETLLIRLIRRAEPAVSRAPESRHAGAEYFAIAAEYVERNLDSSFSVDTLSEVAGVSPSHLERLCRRATGTSVIQFCRARRIERAKELLREGQLSVTAIAAATGFTSVHYFSRTFKDVVGMSPREYVKSIKSMTDRPGGESAPVYIGPK